MALTASFTAIGTSDPSQILVVDNSTGSDGAVVGRKINLYDISNALYGASPFDFPNFPGTTSITINPLQKDKALLLVMTWINNVGAVLYTASLEMDFRGYGMQLATSLTRTQSSKPNIVNDADFYNNKIKLFVEMDSADLSITNMQDISSAQGCIERYYPLVQNPKLYF